MPLMMESYLGENNGELQVRDFFEVHGFHIERIPEIEGEKRADYLANDLDGPPGREGVKDAAFSSI